MKSLAWSLLVAPLVIAACAAAAAPAKSSPTSVVDPEVAKLGGTLVVCNQQAGTAFLIRLSDGTVARKIETGPGPHEAAVSPDGKTAIVTVYGNNDSIGDRIHLIDVAEGKILKTISLGSYTRPHGAAFVGNDKAVLTSETTQNLVLVDLKEGKVERAMSTGAQGSHMLALVPDGKTVYSANVGAGTITRFDVATGEKKGEAKVGAGSEGIGVSPDGQWVLTANRGDQSISLVDTATMRTVKTLPAQGVPYRAAFSPDGKWGYVPNPHVGGLHVVDVAKQELARNIEIGKGRGVVKVLGGPPHPMGAGIFVHPKGKIAFLTVLNANAVAVVDLEKGESIGSLPADASPDGVAWSPVETKG